MLALRQADLLASWSPSPSPAPQEPQDDSLTYRALLGSQVSPTQIENIEDLAISPTQIVNEHLLRRPARDEDRNTAHSAPMNAVEKCDKTVKTMKASDMQKVMCIDDDDDGGEPAAAAVTTRQEPIVIDSQLEESDMARDELLARPGGTSTPIPERPPAP